MSDNLENVKAVYLNDMQIRKLDSIIPHLAIENVYNSNLIDDIGYVDYTENSKGLTCLKPLDGLPDFIDDLYIFKYIHIDEIDKKTINKKKIHLDKGKDGKASLIVKKIDSFFTELFGYFCEQKIAFLVNLQNKEKEKSTIYQTLKAIERRTNNKALDGFKNFYECDDPIAVIKYKVNTSRLPLKEVLDKLETFENRLNGIGAGLMSIDYTRDLSGVLEKKRMIEHFLKLGFIKQSSSEENHKKYYVIDEFTKFKIWNEKMLKDEDEDEEENKIKIIDSDATCGRNTFKYIKNDGKSCFIIKYYNKIVSNFEAGDVQNKIGTHLAEYAFTHSCDHLEKTFRHPDVVERGMTRLEISIHGFDPKINYSYMLDEEFNLVKDAQIFHIQPGAEQWLRLAKNITQCALFANKATYEITMFWYGSSVTKRVAGVTSKKLKKENIDANPKEWENAIKWMILNFGFSGVPIYNISLDVKKEQKQEEQNQEEQKQEEQKQEEQKQEEQNQEEQNEEEQNQEEQNQEEQNQEEQNQEEQNQEEQNQEEQPKRKRGRPTRREEEERRSKLTEEERAQEDELKERRQQQKEERKRRKAEALAAEAERLKNLSREEREQEEERKRQEEERKQQIEEERKQQLEERKKEKKKKEGLKLYITNFSYCLKKGPTILTPFSKPAKMYISTNGKEIKEPPCTKDEIFKYPSTILPETENIQMRFRVESDHKRIGQKKLPKYTLEHFENPGKKISTKSTRERNKLINLENEENKKWIKNKDLNLSIDERRQIKKDMKTQIKTDLKETETIALYEERKDTIDGVFRCFTNPEEIDKVLNENEYIHIFAFKVYPNCTRIAYKIQDETKVCFANPLIKHMLDGLRDTCFNMLPKEETKYKPEFPVYFMPHASLKAKGEDGNDLKIIDEIDGEEIKNFNETLNQHYGDWEELRRLEKLKTPKMEEVFEEVVKPTQTVKLEPGEYTAYKYLKRTFRGKEQIIVYIKREDEREEPIYGYWLNEELKKIDLEKTVTPIYIRLGGEQFNPLRHKDRLATILSTQTD